MKMTKQQESSICIKKDTRNKLRMVTSIRGKTYDQIIREKFRDEFMQLAKFMNEV